MKWSPTSTFDRRAYSPENLRWVRQKDFCNTMGTRRTFRSGLTTSALEGTTDVPCSRDTSEFDPISDIANRSADPRPTNPEVRIARGACEPARGITQRRRRPRKMRRSQRRLRGLQAKSVAHRADERAEVAGMPTRRD